MRLKRLEQIANGRRVFLGKFQKKIPIINALCTKGLKEGHIFKMSKKIGMGDRTDITKQPLQNMTEAENHIQFLEAEADFA